MIALQSKTGTALQEEAQLILGKSHVERNKCAEPDLRQHTEEFNQFCVTEGIIVYRRVHAHKVYRQSRPCILLWKLLCIEKYWSSRMGMKRSTSHKGEERTRCLSPFLSAARRGTSSAALTATAMYSSTEPASHSPSMPTVVNRLAPTLCAWH